LDCKEPGCQVFKQAAPRSVDHLCPECRSHFQALQGLLGRFGVDFELEPALVRGLDYYTRTVFEIVYGGLGAQSAVCGGGRYDGLIEAIGGPPTPAVGYGMGLERVLLTLERESMHLPGDAGPDVFLATAGGADQEVQFRALELLYELRQSGLAAEMDPLGRGLRQQFRQADRLGARLVLTVGPQELETGQVRAKDMSDGSEADVPFSGLGSWVRGYVSGQRQSAVAGAGAPKAREGTP
jgi:histidyl-tRNA synthetase